MLFTFNGTPDEFDRMFRDGRSDEILQAISELKELSKVEAQELTQLNELTNTLATTVQEVVAADQQEDAAFVATIDQLKADVASGKLTNDQLQAELDALKAGVGQVNPKLQAVIDALKSTGTNPDAPLPDAPTV